MDWNWQLAAWPNFEWESGHHPDLEAGYLVAAGKLAGAFGGLAIADAAELRADLLSEEAMETSRIEGEMLDRESVQSSIRRQLGLAVDGRRASPAEQGVAEVMVDAYRSHGDNLSDGKIFKSSRGSAEGSTRVRRKSCCGCSPKVRTALRAA